MWEPQTAILVAAAACGAFAVPAVVLLVLLGPGGPWVASARTVAAGLGLVYSVNLLTLLFGTSWEETEWFVAMNVGFLGMVVATSGAAALVARLVGRPLRGRHAVMLASVAFGFWLAGLYGALIVPGGSAGFVFWMGTLWTGVASLVLTGQLALGWKALADKHQAAVMGTLVPTLVLVALAVANETAGPGVPLSPLFVLWGAVLVYSATFRALVSLPGEEPVEGWCRRHGISDREKEVLRLVAAGLDRNSIADRLFISPVTVKNHLASLYRKTGTSEQAKLADLARTQGMVPPDQGP